MSKLKTLVSDWRIVVVGSGDSLDKVIEVFGNGGYQLALVVGEDSLFLGLITDSDIRKALLRGVSLEQTADEVMNKNPLVVSTELKEEEANKLMKLNHFFHLPVLDDKGRLVGLHVAEQLRSPEELSTTIVIMAGGRGKRLMPLTETTPKPMLTIDGKPILQHIIENAALEGFRKFQISVNYLSEIIVSYFGDGRDLGVEIDYIREEKPLGTAGSLSLLPIEVRKEYVVVTNADVITDVNINDLLIQARKDSTDGLMAVRLQEWQNPFGVVLSKGDRMMDLQEKPIFKHQVNAGIYVLGPRLMDLVEKEEYCDMTELFKRGIRNDLKMNVFPLHESWVDIGRPEDYNSFNR